ncbi:MAG: hypothetical protein KF886_25825 [Candidatus Hydrogenedentes bacterium]|nr:hypothetical protein [Candidatus Hydrogenedentota bacterium]
MKQQLEDRKSIRARVDDLYVSLENLGADAYKFEIKLHFENIGDMAYTVPVNKIRLVMAGADGLDERVLSQGENAEYYPYDIYMVRNLSFVQIKGKTADGTVEVDSIQLVPRGEAYVHVNIDAAPFEAGTLVLPLKQETSGMETMLFFDLKHMLQYRGTVP